MSAQPKPLKPHTPFPGFLPAQRQAPQHKHPVREFNERSPPPITRRSKTYYEDAQKLFVLQIAEDGRNQNSLDPAFERTYCKNKRAERLALRAQHHDSDRRQARDTDGFQGRPKSHSHESRAQRRFFNEMDGE